MLLLRHISIAFWFIWSIPDYFSPVWSILVHSCPSWSTSVHLVNFCPFSPFLSKFNLVYFEPLDPFGPLRSIPSTLVHFGLLRWYFGGEVYVEREDASSIIMSHSKYNFDRFLIKLHFLMLLMSFILFFLI